MRIFSKIIFIFIFNIIFNLTYANTNQINNTTNNPAEYLIKLLNNLNTVYAKFTQIVANKNGTLLQEQVGIMQLKKPNLLSWKIITPDQMLIVSDGNKIWNYDIDLGQVIIKNFNTEITDTKISSLLLGDVSKILNNFEVSIIKDINNIIYNAALELAICFELNNKKLQQEDAFVKAQLGFNNKNQLVIIKVFDQLDQETEFLFSKIKNTVNNSAFKFTIPEGVDVIED